jgi:hypothetical protein
MKPTVAIATALLSFAAGWLLKPSGGADQATAQDPAGSSPARGKSGISADSGRLGTKVDHSGDRPLVLKARGKGTVDPETVSAHASFERTFGSASERADNARLARLAEALGLSPEQRATMAVLLANRRDGFRQLQGGGRTPAESVQQAGQAEQRFMADVKQLLDPEQFAALEDFKHRERENRIEAKAQRDLADLIGLVDLSEAQREQALEVMRRQSSAAATKRPEGWALMNESFGMLGGAHVGILEDLGDALSDPAVVNDPQEVQRRLAEAQRAAAETKANALSSILTPGQLAQFRATQDARSTMMEGATPPKLNPR